MSLIIEFNLGYGMKRTFRFGFTLSLIISSTAFSAADPVEGWYLGLLGQLSHAPNQRLTAIVHSFPPYTAEPLILGVNKPVTLGPVGGGAGASLGYKINMFRVEGELLFNINNYEEYKTGSCTLISPNAVGPRGEGCTYPIYENLWGLGFKGNKMDFYGLINGFVDFNFLFSDPNINIIPYLGLGLGGAFMRSHAEFRSNKYAPIPYPFPSSPPAVSPKISIDSNQSGLAVQGIVGVSWYLDDFATIGVDFRYIAAVNSNNLNIDNPVKSVGISQFGISTINLTFTFALEKGEEG